MFLIFVSSVQKEFREERAGIRDFIAQDPLFQRYFQTFLFEDLPAGDRTADQAYLGKVDEAAIYLGLFGTEYGAEDAGELSPTAREFARATARGVCRLVFVKGTDDAAPHPKMRSLIQAASRQVVRRRFSDLAELKAGLYASLVQFLEDQGKLETLPFDATACPDATLDEIDPDRLRWFLRTARAERGFPLAEHTGPAEALIHLDLLRRGAPTRAAILLFGRDPHRFMPSAEVKCLRFHGTEVRKPIASYQLYTGSVFAQVDQAVDFVLSKLDRSVTPRSDSPATEREYEIPYPAVREAVVNAVAHRDYTSVAGVQVMVFSDRVEVWNPGRLPAGLTPEALRAAHQSIPGNPRICHPLYLAHYVEKAGTGTLDMIDLCRQAELPEPDFEQRGDHFIVTLWRDWLTRERLAGLQVNDRQAKAIAVVRIERRMTNARYQEVTGTTRPTAKRDLDDLVLKGVFRRLGAGRGAYYELSRKRVRNGSNGPSTSGSGNGS